MAARARNENGLDRHQINTPGPSVFGFVYPQIFPTHKRCSQEAQTQHRWARARARRWL